MSKVYICSAGRRGKLSGRKVVLELSSSQDAKTAYEMIKERLPKASIGVFGARDLATFRRTQRDFKASPVVRSISDFIKSVDSKEIEPVK